MMTPEEYLEMAYVVAQLSHDPSTQNGAIIVSNGDIIASGANNFPYGVQTTEERWERPAKYQWVEHAERNAIYDAARAGCSTKETTMYVPWFACADCARAIIQSGITRVVGHKTPLHDDASQSWLDSIAVAYQMFDEAGIKYELIPGTFNHKIRFNGNIVEV